ncbi:MAG: phosphoribosyltransferase, partial [Burkholderiales bacterium]
MPYYLFADRKEAGKALATRLEHYTNNTNVLILALPRGGVPVAAEIAASLRLPLDILLVRKLGVPGQEELAMGAIALDRICVLNPEVVEGLHISESAIEHVLAKEQAELLRRNYVYRQGRPPPEVKNKTVIIVDDGVATGATLRAAISALCQAEAAKIIA